MRTLHTLAVRLIRKFPPLLTGLVFSRLLRWSPAMVAAPVFYENVGLAKAPTVKMRLNPTDTGHQRIAWLGEYESELTERMWELASQGGILLDVGANYGYFTLLWCAARSDNRVVAIEASPRNLDHLRYNIALNGFESRVGVHSWAASDVEGSVSFELAPETQTGWGGIAAANTATTVTVPAHRLDQQFAGQRFSVLKIDCEGADSLVLRGAEQLLQAHAVREVFFEENIPRMASLGLQPGEALGTLTSAGYSVRALNQDATEYHALLPG